MISKIRRRRFSLPRVWLPMLLFMVFSCGTPTEKNESGASRPNIILFMVDDMGWQDTSVPFWKQRTPFNDRYRTPNMEKLAREGMKFTQAYATPVCTPTRVSLITGMNAARHRVTNWTLHPDRLQPMELDHEELIFPDWNVNGLVADSAIPQAVYATPFPKLLQDHGYRTIHVGKAHFGAMGKSGANPLNLGFHSNIAGHAAGAPRSYWGEENFGNIEETEPNPWAVPGLEAYHGQQINLTEALTREAIEEMSTAVARDQPFYLYLAHYTVHTPIMADRRFFQFYLDLGLDSIEAKYASMVESMDQSLGDIMTFLQQNHLSEKTIIIFMSDNGGLSAHTRTGTLHTHNRPLSSGKGSMHEGGIREPMLVKWPGMTQPGSISDHCLIIEDFYPTILEMAGISEFDPIQVIDGESFVPILKGHDELPSRSLFWHYPNEWGPSGPGIGASSTIRKEDWKLIYYHASETFELFNVIDDISETTNLVTKEPEKSRELANELTSFLKEAEAQMPRHKESGKQVKWPDQALNIVLN